MRKAEKENLLQIIDSLKQAHEEVIDAIESQGISSAMNMLGECQGYAINIGEVIEQTEGEGFITITYLEKYCEILFHIYEILSNDELQVDIKKQLDEILSTIKRSIIDDIITRKEIVFFPYKVSMWDSLESVYFAAREDPMCDVYCVPIPYFDKNSDGSFGEMHYEGNEYPDNIVITNWQQYNYENRHPDEIYIHNPYDNWNFVTSVHPKFYAEKLRKFTDKLIYIPYFMIPEMESANQISIDEVRHFIWTPGVIYSDKVIVQSVYMKQLYIGEYLAEAKKAGIKITREQLEQKILGLGSPKLDKIQNTLKKDIEVPKDWLRIIIKSDGRKKKIFFYNTSVAALLEKNEKMLTKIENVLCVFKNHTDEVALLWRPHPLIENTIKAMRPQLWERYKSIVENYIVENWGIYDDSSDIDRAIALSDAYYGDCSSVIQLYRTTNKPIMIQDVECE